MSYRRLNDSPRTLLRFEYNGTSFVAAGSSDMDPGPVPLAFVPDAGSPPPGFLYELLDEHGESFVSFRCTDPTGLLIESPRQEGERVTLDWEERRRRTFRLLVPEYERTRSIRITSRQLRALHGDVDSVVIDRSLFQQPRFRVRLPDNLAIQKIGLWLTWIRPSFTILLVGDGYTQYADFSDDADKLIARLNSFAWLTSMVSLTVLKAFDPSQEDGATVAQHCSGTGQAVIKNTAYGAAYGYSTTANCDVLAGEPEIPETHMWNLGADCVVVLVNSARYGGAGDGLTSWYAAKNELAMDLAVHELGHCLLLSDEYGEGWPGYNAVPDGRNVTDTPATTPWPRTDPRTFFNPQCANINPAHSDPATGAAVVTAAFQGANYDQCLWYRSSLRCEMRDPHDEFCAICRRAIVTEIHARANA